MGRPKKLETLPRTILNVSFPTAVYQQLSKAAVDRTKIFDRQVSMNELVRNAVVEWLRAQETRGRE